MFTRLNVCKVQGLQLSGVGFSVLWGVGSKHVGFNVVGFKVKVCGV
jgi:hypothetical protein